MSFKISFTAKTKTVIRPKTDKNSCSPPCTDRIIAANNSTNDSFQYITRPQLSNMFQYLDHKITHVYDYLALVISHQMNTSEIA